MISTHLTGPARATLPSSRGSVYREGVDPGLLIAGALFLGVVIAEAVFIALTASAVPDIGSLLIIVT